MSRESKESQGRTAETAALLVVDDEPSILTSLKRALRHQSYRVMTTVSPTEALGILGREHVGVVISDYKMPEMDGVAFLSKVKERWPKVQRIMLTGQADDQAIEGVINRSAVFRFLTKPWEPQALILTISDSFEQYRVLLENERLWERITQQNEELKELNKNLEEIVARRTRQLARAKVEWERTFDAIVDPVAIVDETFQVVRANIAYGRHAGMEIRAVPGRRCFELVAGRNSPCERCPVGSSLAGEPPRGVDIPAVRGRVLNAWAFPFRPSQPPPPPSDEAGVSEPPFARTAVCYYRDVTEERALQAKLARTEKLAALGLFVGGVAHEINNPLGGILAFTQLLLRGPELDEETRGTLKDIEQSALRAKRIIDSLQSFAHGSHHLQREEIDLGSLVADAVSSFSRDYASAERLKIEQEVRPGVPSVRGDPALIHQLLRNLLQNAEHATRKQGGRIRIGLAYLADPPSARIEVADDGIGMSDDQVAKIFDPFFTTKGEKEGTGLGLSICHRIVEKHEGHIEVESKPGRGTTFRITLPAATAGAERGASGQKPSPRTVEA